MRTNCILVLAIMLLVSTGACADDWNGPGWYEVLYTTDSGYMIWNSTPFKDEAACNAYVKARFSNNEYAASMRRKYGPMGDHENGFEIVCVEMQTKADAPPED